MNVCVLAALAADIPGAADPEVMSLWVMVALVVLGLTGVLLEPFVPAGGLLAIFGIGLMVTGMGLTFYYHGSEWGIGFLIACIILGPVAAVAAFKLFPHTPIGRRLILHRELSVEDGFQSADKVLEELAGQEGVTLTMLRPSGMARFGHQRVSVVADGELIEKGEAVRVIQVEGSRVLVERVSAT